MSDNTAISRWGITLICAVVLILTYWNLGFYPRTDRDEGFFLLTTRSWARFGKLGVTDVSGTTPYIYPHWITVGPACYLPVMGAYLVTGKLNGLFGFLHTGTMELTLARFVVTLYIPLTILVLWKLAHLLYRSPGANYYLLILAISSPILFFYGRLAKGEIPGVFFVLLAIYQCSQIKPNQARLGYGKTGICLALAAFFKPVFLTAYVAFLPVIILFERIKKRSVLRPMVWLLLPAMVLGCVCVAYAGFSQGWHLLVEQAHSFTGQIFNQTVNAGGSFGMTPLNKAWLLNPVTGLLLSLTLSGMVVDFKNNGFRKSSCLVYTFLAVHFLSVVFSSGGGRKVAPVIVVAYLPLSYSFFNLLNMKMLRPLGEIASRYWLIILCLGAAANFSVILMKSDDNAYKTAAWIRNNLHERVCCFVGGTQVAFLADVPMVTRYSLFLPRKDDGRLDVVQFHFKYLLTDRENFVCNELDKQDLEEAYQPIRRFYSKPYQGRPTEFCIWEKHYS